MDKKEAFKDFVSKHPELVSYVKSKENTWQDFYEIYDIYGENESAWNKYFYNENTTNSDASIGELTNLLKNVNMDNVQKHITNAQKAVSLIQELTAKGTSTAISKTPRPITKFFGD